MARMAPSRPAGALRPLISSATLPWPIEKTWKPPESVTIGRSQRMKRCRPPLRTGVDLRDVERALQGPLSLVGVGLRPTTLSRGALGALDRLLLAAADADGDLARLALLGLGDPHLEHALVEGRLDGVGVHALGQRQRALEAAGRPLDAVVALLAALVLGLALAGHGKDVVLELEVDVALGEPRQVSAQDEVVVGLDQVHRRQPAARAAVPGRPGGGVEERVEEPVHLGLEGVDLPRRLPSNKRHV